MLYPSSCSYSSRERKRVSLFIDRKRAKEGRKKQKCTEKRTSNLARRRIREIRILFSLHLYIYIYLWVPIYNFVHFAFISCLSVYLSVVRELARWQHGHWVSINKRDLDKIIFGAYRLKVWNERKERPMSRVRACVGCQLMRERAPEWERKMIIGY